MNNYETLPEITSLEMSTMQASIERHLDAMGCNTYTLTGSCVCHYIYMDYTPYEAAREIYACSTR